MLAPQIIFGGLLVSCDASYMAQALCSMLQIAYVFRRRLLAKEASDLAKLVLMYASSGRDFECGGGFTPVASDHLALRAAFSDPFRQPL